MIKKQFNSVIEAGSEGARPWNCVWRKCGKDPETGTDVKRAEKVGTASPCPRGLSLPGALT